MAFDAGMVAAVAKELRDSLTGGRIEKIYQPGQDEITLSVRTPSGETKKVGISAGSAGPHIGLTEVQRENPLNCPLFCMLLRKHLAGAKIRSITQPEFERVIVWELESRDEMGFSADRRLISEIMGKYSNLILTDGNGKILGAVRPVDFSASSKRQILPGIPYELPPSQNKRNPLEETEEGFLDFLSRTSGETDAAKAIGSFYGGVSPLLARELVFRVCGRTDCSLSDLPEQPFWHAFSEWSGDIRDGRFVPTLVRDEAGKPFEYAYCPILQYGAGASEPLPSFGVLIDLFFTERDTANRIRQRGSDLFRLLSAAEGRLQKKISLQKAELGECEEKERYRKTGDLITANLWQLKRGMSEASLTDYSADPPAEERVMMDVRLSPSQNAQRYYKRYAKLKNAETALTEQIAKAEGELSYLQTVSDALSRAETDTDLDEIRDELYHGGYASRMKQPSQRKKKTSSPMEFRTSGGFRVLCGRNNSQNELLTHSLARKNDIWFHVKGMPGSHTVLFCAEAVEREGIDSIPERDFTETAVIAAFYSSSAEAKQVPVDYTFVRNLKKPPSAKPGAVIYHTNWSAYVTPDADLVRSLRTGGSRENK